MSYIYIHIPFCRKKCPYCNFVSFANQDNIDRYIALLKTEISLKKQNKSIDRAASIYFGGGTPSFLGSERLNDILSALKQSFYIDKATEITVESNPSDLSLAYLSALRKMGINRISIGTQSFSDSDLSFLGRTHDARSSEKSIKNAHEAGFDNISIDLIYGFNNQSKEQFMDNLKIAAEFPITHISIYCLSVEDGTLFYHREKTGKKMASSDELSSEIYIDSVKFLKKNGFHHYEISNFAKNRCESIHNINYWQEGEYWGFGLSASSYLKGRRIKNTENYNEYADMLHNGKFPVEYTEKLCRKDRMSEELILGLRLTKGINWSRFRQKYGDLEKFSIIESRIDRWITLKMLKMKNGCLSLVFPQGIILSNEVFVDML